MAEARRCLGLEPLEFDPEAEAAAEAEAEAEAAAKKEAKARAKEAARARAEAKAKAEAEAEAEAEAGKEESDEEESDEEEAEQLWVQCDACRKWRRLPESMRDSDELDEAWTCSMHPDPALRGCEVAEEGLQEDEVTTVVEIQGQGTCGTPGCIFADFHLGPCSNWVTGNGGERKRRRSACGEVMADKAAEVKAVRAAKAETKATAKLLQEQEAAKAAAEEQSGRKSARVSRGGSASDSAAARVKGNRGRSSK